LIGNETYGSDALFVVTLTEFDIRVNIANFSAPARLLIENKLLSCYLNRVTGKLKNLEELRTIASDARAAGRTVVFTNGCFDLLHRGHVHILREAKATGDLLIVGINSDRSVRSIKGPTRPILPETDRIELIAAMEMVDYIVLFDEPDPYNVIAALKPQVLAKGGDWSAVKIIGAEVVEREGGRVIVIPYLKGFSTTEIIERIRN
jgi:rfaE bifunctional protein nucleotidyltransferase chain/domain